MNAEQRILAWLERADFTGQGCWHSQDTIARATGCCRRTVIRSVQKLEADGRIRVQRFARGSRRPNVYRVKDWNPHKRSGVLNVLEAIRAARKAECHSKRTAQPSKGADPQATPSSLKVVDQRCGRARLEIGLSRRTWMQEARFHRQRHLTVPDLTCPKCQELAREVEAKDDIIRRYAESETKKAEELSGAWDTIQTQGKEITRLKARLTRQDRESAKLEQVEKVVAHWRSYRPKASKAFGKPGSKSFTIIEKALVLMTEDDHGPVSACCEAIDGLHLAPYQEFDKRFATDGPGRTLRNDVEHALGDEARIERCRGIARRARNVSLDAKHRAYEISAQVLDAWTRALMDELWGQRPDDTVEVDGIVVQP